MDPVKEIEAVFVNHGPADVRISSMGISVAVSANESLEVVTQTAKNLFVDAIEMETGLRPDTSGNRIQKANDALSKRSETVKQSVLPESPLFGPALFLKADSEVTQAFLADRDKKIVVSLTIRKDKVTLIAVGFSNGRKVILEVDHVPVTEANYESQLEVVLRNMASRPVGDTRKEVDLFIIEDDYRSKQTRNVVEQISHQYPMRFVLARGYAIGEHQHKLSSTQQRCETEQIGEEWISNPIQNLTATHSGYCFVGFDKPYWSQKCLEESELFSVLHIADPVHPLANIDAFGFGERAYDNVILAVLGNSVLSYPPPRMPVTHVISDQDWPEFERMFNAFREGRLIEKPVTA